MDTEDDPIFQTQRTGLDALKLEVPAGQYTISLYWAELVSDLKHEKLAYNLGNENLDESSSERIFNVFINGICVERHLNLTEDYGAETAVVKKYQVAVTDDNGITVQFQSIKGEPVLNAFRLYRDL